jgi:hypothetical protein
MRIILVLLLTGRRIEAALILWGPRLFDPRPSTCQRIIESYEANAKLILLGAAKLGKTYVCTALMLQDYLCDPEYVSIHVLSASGKHAKSNAFSAAQRLVAESVISFPGQQQSDWIGLNPRDRRSGMAIVPITKGESGYSGLQGLHSPPRKTPHPLWESARVRILCDESEMIPPNVKNAIANQLSSLRGIETLKVVLATNPWNVNSDVANKAQPLAGWRAVDIDNTYQWLSEDGWWVVRLDGLRTENVQQKKVVFPTLLTYEGYMEHSQEEGQNRKHLCYGRALYWLAGTEENLIPHSFIDHAWGRYMFDPGSVRVAGCDIAYEGDRTVLCTGEYGRATAWQHDGLIEYLSKPKWCLQVDQFFTLPRGLDTEGTFEAIRNKCSVLGIPMDYLCTDATGNAKGPSDMLAKRYGSLGLDWGSASTDTKVLASDNDLASELYDGIVSEIWFSVRKYLEAGCLKFNPHICEKQRLVRELTGRRYERSGRIGKTGISLHRVEQKRTYKKGGNPSPDYADSLCMALFVARQRSVERPYIGPQMPIRAAMRSEPDMSHMKFVDFSREESAA